MISGLGQNWIGNRLAFRVVSKQLLFGQAHRVDSGARRQTQHSTTQYREQTGLCLGIGECSIHKHAYSITTISRRSISRTRGGFVHMIDPRIVIQFSIFTLLVDDIIQVCEASLWMLPLILSPCISVLSSPIMSVFHVINLGQGPFLAGLHFLSISFV